MRFQDLTTLALATMPVVKAVLPANSTWSIGYAKAKASVEKLTLEEKANIVTGVGWEGDDKFCGGNTYPVPSINYPSLCLEDGPLGVRHASSNTAFPPGIHAASTWDLDLMRQRGQFIGEEAKAIGIHVMLGPVAGALGKIVQGGRNWEGFGPDPYLTGLAMAATIEGTQSAGVQATAKHFILNEQEKNRRGMSGNADDRTIHELYVWPFADAVHANVASVMTAYNKVNGTDSCESNDVMNKLLKEQLGFPGYIMTDWASQSTTDNSANSGLDMTMPGSGPGGDGVHWGQFLVDAVNAGNVSTSRMDDMVTRILAAWYMLGQDQNYPTLNYDAEVQGNHKDNVRAIARDGIVLLKNEDSILPFTQDIESLAVIGTGAFLGNHATNQCPDNSCAEGAIGMGWGSGTCRYPYFSAPYDAINGISQTAGFTISPSNSDDPTAGATAAQGQAAALVFLTTLSGEDGDRSDLNPFHNGNNLVKAVAAANENLIVVIHSVGPVILEEIVALPQVKAIIWAGLPAQENGNALTDILWGATSPNGKLVYTIAKDAADYGTQIEEMDDDYSEGLFVDYRHFDKDGIEPRYEFGFGLSYTTFEYANLEVSSTATSGPLNGAIIPGGATGSFDTVATVTLSITNTGPVQGAEVVQLYLSYPSSAPETPPNQLRGFDKLSLDAGAEGTAVINIRKRDLSVWDPSLQQWVIPAGEFTVRVGASSRDIRLEGTLTVD